MPARIEYEQRADAKARFFIVGGNNEVIVKSQWYDNRSNAHRGYDDLVAAIGDINIAEAEAKLAEPAGGMKDPRYSSRQRVAEMEVVQIVEIEHERAEGFELPITGVICADHNDGYLGVYPLPNEWDSVDEVRAHLREIRPMLTHAGLSIDPSNLTIRKGGNLRITRNRDIKEVREG